MFARPVDVPPKLPRLQSSGSAREPSTRLWTFLSLQDSRVLSCFRGGVNVKTVAFRFRPLVTELVEILSEPCERLGRELGEDWLDRLL